MTSHIWHHPVGKTRQRSASNPKGIVSSSPRLASLRAYLGSLRLQCPNRNAVVARVAHRQKALATTALRLKMRVCR
jgi:hypothetical protein